MIKKSFKKALCLLCAVALIASTLVVMSVSTSAAAISSDESIFTSLMKEQTLVLPFDTTNTSYKVIGPNNTQGCPGISSGTSSDTTNARMYARSNYGESSGGIKWADSKMSCGIMLGKDNVVTPASSVTDYTSQYAYTLEPNTKYSVSFKVYDSSSDANISYNFMGVANKTTTEGTIYHTLTFASSAKAWTTYTGEFTTGEDLGDNIYLAFIILNPNGTTFSCFLDEITITKYAPIDTAEVITFNDNGKTYYAYPDKLTALPEGDNGTLGSEFIGWVDADGNTVTEVPAAGTVLNAKYPFVTKLPDKVTQTYLSLKYPGATGSPSAIANSDSKGVYGIASSTGAGHLIYPRSATLADGTSAYIVKFAKNTTSADSANMPVRGITFGKTDANADGKANAFILKSDTNYTVSYKVKHVAGADLDFKLMSVSAVNSTTGTELASTNSASPDSTWKTITETFTTGTVSNELYLAFHIYNNNSVRNEVWIYDVTITETVPGAAADYISFVDGDDVYYTSVGDISALPKGQSADGDESFLGWYDGNGDRVTEVPTEAGVVLTAQYGVIKDGTVATSIREVSGSGSDYVSAGIRFRARLDSATVEAADEVGFILVPNGEAVDSENALKGVAKNKNTHIIYDLTYDGFIDYQVIVTGLTREGDDTNLCDLKIDVYFYYILNGDTNYVGQPYSTSYNEVLALYEADLPVVNNTLTEITTAPIGEAATDKLIGTTLTLTPPEYKTTIGSASYLDAADGATLMTVTNTTKVEYEAYLAKLDTLGYTAVVGNSRILSSSQSFSAIYSDGTNLINVAFIASEKTVKATIEPLGFDNVDGVNSYLSIFHDASAANPETYVCDPLFLTIGLSTSENNNDDGLGFYHGLGYIYRLADGSFVIIDGGNDGEIYDHAGKIYSMLKYYAPDPENIVISAWIMTHAHGDHMYVFKSFAPKYLADEAYNVTLKNIIANLPNENWVAGGGMPETNLAPFRTLYAECEQRGTNVYKAHVGQVYNLPGFTAEMLYTLEQTAPTVVNNSMSNTSSLIFRSVIEDKSFLFTADATSTSINHVNAAFGKKMDSDFVQVPHHGTLSNFATDTRAELGKFYTDYTTPTYALWPSAEAGMNIYLAKTVDENINAILGTMMPYDHMITLGHNIEEIKLNSETVDIKTLEYYEIGYLRYEPQAITTEAELKAIADNPYGYYYLANDITVTEEFTAPYWSKFAGYLDGKGHTVTFANDIVFESAASNNGIICNSIQGVIRNVNFGSESAPLNIAYSETASGAMGLFGSTLADITFDNVKVYAEIAHTVSSSYGNYVGGFLGRIYHSSGRAAIATFKNCQFIGSYTDSASGGLKVFGGLVGGMTGAGRLNVSGCTINATVNGKSTDSAAGIGGVIGRISSARTVYISDTTAIGTYNGGKYAGGIIGNADTTSGIIKVTDCTAPGALCGNAGTRVEIITAK